MEFDILNLTEEELDALSVIQVNLLRTAQQTKNELFHEMEKKKEQFKITLANNNTGLSSLYYEKCQALEKEFDYQVEILRERLVYNMSLNEPTVDEDTGGGGSPDTGDSPYPIDYSLEYIERYIIVRDYYLTIEDPNERLALYQADEVAQRYLSVYYNTLYNYLTQLI